MSKRCKSNIEIHVNSNIERALRQLKKKIEREGVVRDMKRGVYFESPTQKRRKRLMRAIRHLDLSEEQKLGIKAVMQGLKEEIHPIMQDMRTGHEQLRELVKAESYNKDAVALVAENEGDLAAQRIMLTSEALSNILAQLTEEQREQLDTMAAERKERASNRQGQRGGKNKSRSWG